MCVWNIWIDVKLPKRLPSKFFSKCVIFKAGGQSHVCSWLPNEEGCIHDWYDSGALESHTCTMSISWWVVANPRTTLPSFQQTFSTMFDVTLLPVRFSQSVILGAIWLYWKGRVCFQSILFSTGYGDDSFHCFSGPFIDPFLSGETGVFLHARCTPQQNSQWLFWASAWLMLDSSWWHEPFGEYLSR